MIHGLPFVLQVQNQKSNSTSLQLVRSEADAKEKIANIEAEINAFVG